MNRTLVGLLALVALLIATPLMAQPQRGQGRGQFGQRGGMGLGGVSKLQLLQNENVQKELALGAAEKEQVAKIAEEARPGRRGAGGFGPDATPEERAKFVEEFQARQRETDKKVAAVLDESQKTRLNEIHVQALGTAALSDEAIAKKLNITEDQQAKIAEVRREARQAARGEGGRGAFSAEARAEVDKKVLAVLSSDQQEQFAKMQGKKVDFDLTAIIRGGFGRGGQRRGGNQ